MPQPKRRISLRYIVWMLIWAVVLSLVKKFIDIETMYFVATISLCASASVMLDYIQGGIDER